jgi:phospholipid transport system substrate-binding protein
VRHALFWLLSALTLMAALVTTAKAQQTPTADDPPNVLIQKAAGNALEAIRGDQQLKTGSLDKVNQAIDELILPYVDFTKTTRLAMGQYWRKATPEQQTALTQEFRNMLVRTYGGAVANISPAAKVVVTPFRGDAAATDVVVRTMVSDGDRDPVPVDYRLEKTDQGWKIYDLNVLGVWFIQNYRNQFSTIAAQSGVDGVIKALKDRNEQMRVPVPAK